MKDLPYLCMTTEAITFYPVMHDTCSFITLLMSVAFLMAEGRHMEDMEIEISS